MQFLKRLTLVDLAIIAVFLATAIVWVVTRSDSGGNIEDIDAEAWQASQTQILDAFADNDLSAAKAGLLRIADIAEPAKDDAADGIRAFADVLTGTDVNAVADALRALDPVPQSILFQGLYLTIWTPLVQPDLPTRQPEAGREWVHVATAISDGPIEQYWGTARWSAADDASAAVTAAVDVADLGLAGTLSLVDGDDGLLLSLALGDLYPGATLDAVIGFSSIGADDEAILDGRITSFEDGIVVMALSPDAREGNLNRLRNTLEIGVGFNYDDGRWLILRIQVGVTGRAAIAAAFPPAPAN